MEGLDASQLVIHVIRPTLEYLEWWSPAAERLVLGTGIHESRLKFIKQIGTGPALGIYQMEPLTADDIWGNFLVYQPVAEKRIKALLSGVWSADRNLQFNLAYATAMCRAHYRRRSAPLPAPDNASDMAYYHKRYYNTALGATDPAKSIEHFRQAIEICEDL